LARGKYFAVGQNAHAVSRKIEDETFLATGTEIVRSSPQGSGSEVQAKGTLDVTTRLAPVRVIPMGWVAMNDPAEMPSTEQHDRIRAMQEWLNFSRATFGLDRNKAALTEVLQRLSGVTDWALAYSPKVLAPYTRIWRQLQQ